VVALPPQVQTEPVANPNPEPILHQLLSPRGREANGNLMLTWTGAAVLQHPPPLTGLNNGNDMTPAPAGNTYTIAPAARTEQGFYRLRQ
jgi:hypothetical protein